AVLTLEAQMTLRDLDHIAGGDDDVVEDDLGARANDLESNLLPLLRILGGGFQGIGLAIEPRRRQSVAEEHAIALGVDDLELVTASRPVWLLIHALGGCPEEDATVRARPDHPVFGLEF